MKNMKSMKKRSMGSQSYGAPNAMHYTHSLGEPNTGRGSFVIS